MKQISVIWISIMLAFSSAFMLMDVSDDTEGKTIINNGIEYVPHAPIRINSNSEFDEAHGVVNWATGNGSQGNPWIIENYDIDGAGYSYCIYVGNTTEYFVVRECLVQSSSGFDSLPYFWRSSIHLYNVQNGNVTNNTAVGNQRCGILLISSASNTFTNNLCGSNLVGIRLRDSDSNTLTNNFVSSNQNNGIQISFCDNTTLSNNTVNNNGIGILMFGSNNNTLHNNTVSSNNYCGILLEWCTKSTLSNNTASSSLCNEGFRLCFCSNITLTCNIVSNNDWVGFYLWNCTSNTLSNNTVSWNHYEGIYLYNSTGNTLVCNIISNNDCGIYLGPSCYGNLIYHNNIINNTDQAYDDDNNFWDNGYPDGGNYWSDYSGVDFNSTPTQDVPPPDGIGDTPYTNIQGGAGAQDNYPLMEPYQEKPEYSINFSEGWNIISIPLTQLNYSLDSVLDNINGKWDYAQTYNRLTGVWESNSPYRPESANDFQSMSLQMGFWINITEPDVVLTVVGEEAGSVSIPLYAGWNLVGYPTMSPEMVANALWGTGADKVEVFDAAEPYRVKEVGPTYVMKPGEGYWVHVPADTTWVIDW